MTQKRLFGALASLSVVAVLPLACTATGTATSDVIAPGPKAQDQLLQALIGAEIGDIIQLAEGRFELDTTLSLDVAGVTVRGQGLGKTVLDFSRQVAGSGGEGLMVTADSFTIEDLSVVNSRGDAIKVEGTTGVTFRRVRIDWEGPPKTENGAYGLYPVQCNDVLIEDSEVRGASDAGIYVGQSKNIIVRRNRVWENVAGIEIENSTGADVHDNVAFNNTGGVLVFSLPEMPVKNGRDSRIYDNQIYENNHPNFGKPGAIVSTIPPGAGVIIMANENTEVWGNTIRDNQTANLSVTSFTSTGREYNDPAYDPFAEGISIHDNTFSGGGTAPMGAFADAVRPHVGEQFPDIVWDGVVDAAKMENGETPARLRIYVANNGDADFANVDMASVLAGKPPKIDRDLAHYAGALPEPPRPVTIAGT